MKTPRLAGLTFLAVAGWVAPGRAEVIALFEESLSFFNNISPGTATAIAGATANATNPLGTGLGMNFVDLDTGTAVRAIGTLPAAIGTQFRWQTEAFNNAPGASTNGARLRFGNSPVSGALTTESNAAFTFTFRNDDKVQAKYSDGASSPTLSQSITPGLKVKVDLVVNADPANPYAYTFGGTSRTLNPETYDVFVDGALMTGSLTNGFAFYGANYLNAASSILELGFVAATADTGVNWTFDNMFLFTGSDISVVPEPAVSSLLLAGLASLGLFLRRRRQTREP